MDNEVQRNIPPIQSLPQTPNLTPTPTHPSTNLSRVLLFTVLGLFIIAGSVFAGIQIGKNQTPNQQPIITQPVVSPTESIANAETVEPTPEPTKIVSVSYVPGKDWHSVKNTTLGLVFCLPPKWDFTKNGDDSFSGQLTYYRDPAYAPPVAFIRSIPYSSGSRREAYFSYWEAEYPDVRTLVSVKDVPINTNSALLISPKKEMEPKYSPEGLTVIWLAEGKLWKANIDSWSYVNDSQSAFLKDFYTAISCSF